MRAETKSVYSIICYASYSKAIAGVLPWTTIVYVVELVSGYSDNWHVSSLRLDDPGVVDI